MFVQSLVTSSRSVHTATQADAVDATCDLVAGGSGADGGDRRPRGLARGTTTRGAGGGPDARGGGAGGGAGGALTGGGRAVRAGAGAATGVSATRETTRQFGHAVSAPRRVGVMPLAPARRARHAA